MKFHNFYTYGDKNEYSTIACNYLLDDVFVTRHRSCQFNFSLLVKIKHVEFVNKFLINPRQCEKIFDRILPNEFSNKSAKKQTMNDFLRKSGTIGSTERTEVSGWLFCVIFSLSGKVEIGILKYTA